MSIWKQGATVTVSTELLADACVMVSVSDSIAAGLDDHLRNGHLGPVHHPTRWTLHQMKVDERRRNRLRHELRALMPGKRPGRFVRVVTNP